MRRRLFSVGVEIAVQLLLLLEVVVFGEQIISQNILLVVTGIFFLVHFVIVGSVDGDSVIVRKAFPLFHAAGALGLAPMLEAALMLVRRI